MNQHTSSGHNRVAPAILACLVQAVLVSCAEKQPSAPPRPPTADVALVDGPGPRLRLVDSVIFQESDTLYLGKVGQSFAVDNGGMIYLPDELSDHLIQYSPAGKPVRVFGKPGHGPGELASIGVPFVIDSFLVQAHGTSRLAFFDLRTGNYLFSRLFRGYTTSIAIAAGVAWIGVFDLESRHGVAEIASPTFFAPDSSEGYGVVPASRVPCPTEYSAYPGLDIFNYVSVTAVGDRIVVGYAGGSDALILYDPRSGVTDTIDVPVVARRGMGIKALAKLAPGARARASEQLMAVSALYGLWTLSDGSILTWHEDNSAKPRGRRGLSAMSGRAFLSIVAADMTRACVDSEVSFPGTEWPRIAFAHDTVYALDQTVPDSGAPRVVTVARRYAVDTTGCRWLKLQRAGTTPMAVPSTAAGRRAHASDAANPPAVPGS